jgi:hypothetical protein
MEGLLQSIRRNPLPGIWQGLRQVSPDVTAADLRRWLRRADPALVATAHLAEPVALGLLVVTGWALPWLVSDWTPISAFRALHLLAGEVLALVLSYRVLALTVRGARRLVQRSGVPWRRPLLRRPLAHAALPSAMGWRGIRDPALELAYQATLAVCVLSGIERAVSARTGQPLLGLLSVAETHVLHVLAAPYFYTALLLLSYVEGRKRARALLHELRSP